MMQDDKRYWSYNSIDSIPPAQVSSQLSQCLSYIYSLRRAWSALEIPQLWIDRQVPILDSVYRLPSLEDLLGRSILYMLNNQLVAIPDEVLEQRSPYGPNPSFFLSIGRYCYWKEEFRHTSISWDQLSQFLMFEGSEYTAECAIASSLDGIPSTLVRKNELVVSRRGCYHKVPMIDLAVLYTPIGPSTNVSQERARYLPICQSHPALALCSKGPTKWENTDDTKGPSDLSDILETMASAATVSLDSMINVWRRRGAHMQASCPSDISDDTGGCKQDLPDWAFLIGVVYDAEVIHFVAHIPYIPEGEAEYQYLSLLFETLPFAANDTSTSSESSLADRYRVALAFLCLQHHIFRLTSLWDGIVWPPEVLQEPLDVVRELMDTWCETPTPSQPSSDFVVLPPGFEIEYDDDDDLTHVSDPVTAPDKVRPQIEEWLKTLEGVSFDYQQPWKGIV
ncbi:hypothetical protein OBBRIDRAFT_889554 [Obba rivulosa]|uniref:Uncharacterized protein n=1 Tax=Obba rivulosa TaxID=1052685 RepID=A0A8E2AR21_9APHY|nr:hypothetical protein OBBRIDRAFT_889554 [Obba rivulosa]